LQQRRDGLEHPVAVRHHRCPQALLDGRADGAPTDHHRRRAVKEGELLDLGHEPKPEHMVLRLHGREHHLRQRVRPRAQDARIDAGGNLVTDRRRQMLVPDRDEIALPEITDPMHRGLDQTRADGRDVEPATQSSFSDRPGRVCVSGQQFLTESSGELARVVRGSPPSDAPRRGGWSTTKI
jgi:hypothetical protein